MTYQVILTTTGAAKLAAGIVNLTHMAIGDGGGNEYTPTGAETALVNEVYRQPLSAYNVTDNKVIMQLSIPLNDGGFYICEAGIYDDDGDLIYIANLATRYKPLPTEGSPSDLTITLVSTVSNIANLSVTVDGTAYVTESVLTAALAVKADITYVDDGLSEKVDKVTGKGLSANDFTDADVDKLDGIAENATANTAASDTEAQAATDAAKFMTPESTHAAYGAADPVVLTSGSSHDHTIAENIITGAIAPMVVNLADIANYPKSKLNRIAVTIANLSNNNWTVNGKVDAGGNVNLSITGATTAAPTYALDATSLPTVVNGTIASNLFTATANAASAQMFDYVAAGVVTAITPTMKFIPGTIFTVDPSSTTGNLKLNSATSGLLTNGDKLIVEQSGAISQITINAVSGSTGSVPSVAASTIYRNAGVLNDGTVFITGGGIANSYNYNPGSQIITNKANNPSGSSSWYFGGACMVNNKMYCWGDSSKADLLRIYDTSNNTWSTGLAPGRSMIFPIAVPLNDGTIFLVGGANTISTSSNITQIYNPATNSYTIKANAPGGIDAGGGVQIDNDNVIVTRYRSNGTNTTLNLWKYTISTNTWSSLADSPVPMLSAFMYLKTPDVVYVFCGKLYTYTISTNTWSAALSFNNVDGSYFKINNDVFAINNSGVFYQYNFTDNTWVAVSAATTYTVTSPSLSVAVPAFVAKGGEQLQYSVSAISTPSFSAATLSYTRSGNVITATGTAVTVNGQHVQLKALSLNNGDILSQISATLATGVAQAINGNNSLILAPGKIAMLIPTTNGWLSERSNAINVQTVTANYTMTAADDIAVIGANNITVTLPSAAAVEPGRVYKIKAGDFTGGAIATQSSQTVDGTTPPTLNALDSLSVYSDGANWLID